MTSLSTRPCHVSMYPGTWLVLECKGNLKCPGFD
uniref:Uncharacterized protein n=1 Tax=Rhizophora mucronata TaxID=61149 RepID=A0A2P2NBC9_RHIMU